MSRTPARDPHLVRGSGARRQHAERRHVIALRDALFPDSPSSAHGEDLRSPSRLNPDTDRSLDWVREHFLA